MRVLVVGLGVTGEAVARRYAGRGPVTVVEDRPVGDAFARRAEALRALGVDVLAGGDEAALARLVRRADLVVPSPGVGEAHPVYRLADDAGVELVSEVELAGRAARENGTTIVAVTGTNGKTTVTTLIARMLGPARATAAGNIGRPLIEAVDDGVEVVVAEVSSFQLRFTTTFAPRVAVFLNVAPDHLDWHRDFDAYVAAKSNVFARQAGDDLLVANADDPATARAAMAAPARVTYFSFSGDTPWRVEGDCLVGPGGPVLRIDDLRRPPVPHDLSNALAALAAVADLGVSPTAAAAALRGFGGLPHRVTPVGQSGGVNFVDDSKATNPHAALAALDGFDSVVLVAGGRNKGLDLSVLASRADRIRAVVGIGEAAGEVAGAFAGLRPVEVATSMGDAVRRAAALARPGDTVLLSPACASFDWYSGYAARGDDFAACVRALTNECDGR